MTTTIGNNNCRPGLIWKDRIERALDYVCCAVDSRQRNDAM